MGFGYLLYGFLMMIGLYVPTDYGYGTGIDAFPDLAGYLFLLTALLRLAAYAPGFRKGKVWMTALLPVGAVKFIASGLSLYSPFLPVLSVILNVCDLLTAILCPFAFFFLFSGIYSLANEVALPKLAKRARRAAVFGFVNYGMELFLTVTALLALPLVASGSMQIFRIVKQLVGVVYIVYCEIVSFNAYMYICYEGEENTDGPLNPFSAFLNRLFKREK